MRDRKIVEPQEVADCSEDFFESEYERYVEYLMTGYYDS